MIEEREIHPSHRPEPEGERLYKGGRSCRLCMRFVETDGIFSEVTRAGVRPCYPPAAEAHSKALRA